MKWPRSGIFKMTHNTPLPINSATNLLRPAVPGAWALWEQAVRASEQLHLLAKVARFPAVNDTLREGCVD